MLIAMVALTTAIIN